MVFERLLKLLNSTGYTISQHNGQRKFGPPTDWDKPPPPKGCEVFIGKLPREVFEDELVPLFSRVGRIYELRMMLNFTGLNKGYAFLNYCTRSEATAAIRELHNYEIRPGHRIAVVISVDNCRLYLGGIPKRKTREDIREELSKHVTGIVDVILYKNCFDRRFNRGFAFMEFSSHRAAAMARKALSPCPVHIWDHDVIVDWAEPEPDVDENVMKKVKVLYLRNLYINTETDTIRQIFEKTIGHPVERVKKIYDYAFIHFYEREHAELAIKYLQHVVIDKVQIEIKWAKPVDRDLYKVQKMTKGNSKFNNSPYKNEIAESELAVYSPDEGVASDSYSGSHSDMTSYKHAIHPDDPTLSPIYKLEELCKRCNWPSPLYQFQKCLREDGLEACVCKVEFGYIRQGMGAPCWQVMSVPCLTSEEAQLNAAYASLTHMEMIQQNELVLNSYPQIYQPSIVAMNVALPTMTATPWHSGVYVDPSIPMAMW